MTQPKPLSPAAQAVVNAMVDVVCTPPISLDEPPPSTLATKLMGAACLQTIVKNLAYLDDDGDLMLDASKLHAIAAELEDFNG